MKDIQQVEFRAFRTSALHDPLYIVETHYNVNFEQLPASKPIIQYPRQQKIF